MTDNNHPITSMTKLSPAAQAVLDASINAVEYVDGEWVVNERAMLAAALRAAVDQLGFVDDYGTCLILTDDLLAIANEFESP